MKSEAKRVSKATPRPWSWAKSPKFHGGWQLWSDHEKGIYNTWIANSKGESISTDENYANAELIVRAVNCHDELLAYFEKDYLEWKLRYEAAVETKNRSWLASYKNQFIKMQDLYIRARGE